MEEMFLYKLLQDLGMEVGIFLDLGMIQIAQQDILKNALMMHGVLVSHLAPESVKNKSTR